MVTGYLYKGFVSLSRHCIRFCRLSLCQHRVNCEWKGFSSDETLCPYLRCGDRCLHRLLDNYGEMVATVSVDLRRGSTEILVL